MQDYPVAETVLLQPLVETDIVRDFAALCTLLAGRVISTGDRIGGYEVVEIVPPDEPALVVGDTEFEFV